MAKKSFIVILAILVLSLCNIWDNVYSQAKASMPIVFEQALNIDFNIRQYSSKVNLDFNPKQQIITLATYFDLLLAKMQIFKAQLDLHELVLTFKRQGKSCQRFKLATLEKVELGSADLTKERMSLVNILFKFTGESQRSGQAFNKFLFDPFIFGKNSTQFQNFTSSLNNQLSKEVQDAIRKELNEDIKQKLDDLQQFNISDINYDLFIYADKTKGTPKLISYAEKGRASKEANIPFKLFSNVNQPMKCSAQIKTISNEQLGKLIANTFNSAGDFTKYFN